MCGPTWPPRPTGDVLSRIFALALLPQLDRLLAVVPGVPEAQCRERGGGQRVLFRHAELDELQAGHAWRRRRAVERAGRHTSPMGDSVLDVQQGPHGVTRVAFGIGTAEDRVEDLQRQRAGVPGDEAVLQETGDIPRTLTGPHPVMPAPLEDVHRHLGRVRELDEEDLLARDVADGPRVEPTREHMEGVLTGTQRRVVGHPHDLPRAAVVPDVGRPGQGLERDPHAALVRQLGGLVQLLRGQLVVVDGVGLAARADEDQVGTQLGHDVELALEAPHRLRVLRLGHAFQVAEGLQHLDLETEFVAALLDPAWGPQAAEQVLVEDLDPVEPGVCHRSELLVEGARQGDRGDRPTHSWTVATGMRRGHALADQWQELASRGCPWPV